MICQRCKKDIDDGRAVNLTITSDIPKTTGTDINLCHDCGTAATLLIGEWLAEISIRFMHEFMDELPEEMIQAGWIGLATYGREGVKDE